MIKKFRRPAAGIEEQIPSDLRPPEALQRTLNYIITEIIGGPSPLSKSYPFLWDRTRGIRNDFSVQNVKNAAGVRIAIDCFERIVRIHLLTLHQIGARLPESDGKYNHQQDMEQCGKSLISLIAYYDAVRERYRSPNEPEFRAYWILTRIPRTRGADLEAKVQKWPRDLLEHPRVRVALEIHAAACSAANPDPRTNNESQVIGQQNWTKFFRLVGSTQTSYLLACLAEVYFNDVRIAAIHAIRQTYYRGRSRTVDDWTLEKLREPLGFDTEDDVREFLETFKFDILQRPSDGKYFMDLKDAKTHGFPTPESKLRFSWFSESLVECKRFGRTFPAILNGLGVKAAREHGQVEEVEEPLFVSDDEQVSEQDHRLAQEKTILNPAVSIFQPTQPQARPTEKPTPFNPFGASSNLPRQSGPSPNPFGQPATNTPTPETSGLFSNPFAPKPSNTPQSTTFATPNPAAAATTAPAAPATSAFASPFGNMTGTPNLGASIFQLKPTTTDPAQTAAKPNPSPVAFGFSTASQAASSTSPFASTATTIPQAASSASPFTTTTAAAALPGPNPNPFAPASGLEQQSQNTLSTPQLSLPAFGVSKPESVLDHPPAKQSTPGAGLFQFPKPDTTATTSQAAMPSVDKSPFNFLAGSASQESAHPKAAKSQPPFPPITQPLPAVPSVVPSADKNIPLLSQKGPSQAPQKQVHFALSEENSESAKPNPTKAVPSAASSGRPVSGVLKPSQPSRRAIRKEQGLNYIATQLLLDPDNGFLTQYVEFIAAPMIYQAMTERQDELARNEADSFRWKSVARQTWKTWRKITRQLRYRREGRERRARMIAGKEKRRQAAQKEQERPGQGKSYAERTADFEAVTAKAQARFTKLVLEKSPTPEPSSRRNPLQTSESSKPSSSSAPVRTHRRTKTQPAVPAASQTMVPHSESQGQTSLKNSRRSSLASSSFLSGNPLRESGSTLRGRLSTMTSNYFRLKARGLESLSDVHAERTNRKRMRLSGSSLISPPSTTGSPEHVARLGSPRSYPHRHSTGKQRPADMLEDRYTPSESPPLKRKAHDDTANEDEELFARVRKVRKAMDEGISFYKEELRKDELSRSSSTQGSMSHVAMTGLSPDELFQSQTFPPRNYFNQSQQLQLHQSERPKYHSRVSKFIPREEYGLGPATKRARVEHHVGAGTNQWPGLPTASNAPGQRMANGNGHDWEDEVEDYSEEDYDEDEEDNEETGQELSEEQLKGGNSIEDAIEL
jgi:SAC3/GANP family